MKISERFDAHAEAVLFPGDCLKLLRSIPNETVRLVVTSPPYNIGKPYEKRLNLDTYISQQTETIRECVRVLQPDGSICWQTGNYIRNGEIIPLDSLLFPAFQGLGLKMRNRIVWHFEHGLHCSKRFSGRYETIAWFTKNDKYIFNIDAVRVPQKYPGKKHFRGPKAGTFSCNPLGKNPGDLWIIPNVKNNHVEKTDHPCQFPVELVERLVLALTNEGDWVCDPFMGVGSTAVAALLRERRPIGAEILDGYVKVAKERMREASNGTIRIRPMNRPIYDPTQQGPEVYGVGLQRNAPKEPSPGGREGRHPPPLGAA